MKTMSCLLAVLGCLICGEVSAAGAEGQWLQWRGPEFNGVAPDARPPVTWSEGENVRWKVALPGNGLSTPIIWNDRVFVQTAIPIGAGSARPQAADAGDRPADARRRSREGGDGPRGERRGRRGHGMGGRREAPTEAYKFTMMALDRRTGKTVWERTVREAVPHEGTHRDGSFASASPVTDGKRLYTYFGSRGLYCFDMAGKLLWEKDLGDMRTRYGFGEGSSPALHGDTLIVNWDHEGDSFIVALDASTGKEQWRQSRDEPTSWATPLIVRDGDDDLAIVSGTRRIRAYDLATGDIRWECGGLGVNCIPSPVARGGHVYAMSGYRDPALVAIRFAGAKGDITGGDRVSWTLDGDTPYVPSPLLYGDALYFVRRNSGILSCYNSETGSPFYKRQRLDKINGVYASPVGADDRVYIVGRNGVTYVLKRGPRFEVLATNELDDGFDASPAVAGKELYLRGKKSLYCIATD